MIYDCFTFFNELDLLEIKLEEEWNVVDKFIVLESTVTHSNKPKNLFYSDNKERFKKYEEKIIYVVCNNASEHFYGNDWDIDNYTRDILLDTIHPNKEDLIIINDADQIVNHKVLENFIYTEPCKLEMDYFYYYFNCLHTNMKWYGTSIYKYSDIKEKLSAIRFSMPQGIKIIPNGGWHFSYLGNIEFIKKKIEALAHRYIDTPEFKNDYHIEQSMIKGMDLFDRLDDCGVKNGAIMKFFPLDNLLLPGYIIENKERYKQYIKQ